ncbi:modification methylase BspRI [Oxobacter pfennigii]|uniref:DNA (cytosine-5-)-methyltransferase n=1 Tax=Oxobacter pfennigii TaxID=36849 RepID=A0A0P8WJ81_9CLOT|nr:DNA cytosine methyltransferase [Oxobacter pfennigii]KPU42183.1 modification methylase BspRI [Oxobacter pfennigii]
MQEIIVDNFAGGGGASKGAEMATGRPVDIAINHDPYAIAMHKVNHPNTKHYCENVWEVDPVEACAGRPVGLAWFSPDCKHFSKAKGGKPVDKNIRGLAWVVIKWAKLVRPRVIMLENVEEFKTWGPLVDNYPDPKRKGETFNLFIKALKKYGYKVDWRELRACDYGAPTIRKRLFLIARCDGKKIVWPEPTHGVPDSLEVYAGLLKPLRTAAEIIDWSLPCPSIFERKKPLAENTLRRIAKGIQKFVIDNPEPFIVQVNHSGAKHHYCNSINAPLPTITAKHGFGIVTPVITQLGHTGGGDRLHGIEDPLSTIVSKAEHMLVTPFLTQYHSYDDNVRGQTLDRPLLTQDTSNRYALTCAFLTKYYGGNYKGDGAPLNAPVHTITAKDHHALVTSHLIQMNNNCDGTPLNKPLNTIVAGPGHIGEVRTFLMSYYGNDKDIGQRIDAPLRTITAKDRFGIITVKGKDYQIVDIGMRMLEPHELFAAQGFPSDYIIDRDDKGNPYPKTQQVARCGNSVSPVIPEALIRANLPELCTGTTDAVKEA